MHYHSEGQSLLIESSPGTIVVMGAERDIKWSRCRTFDYESRRDAARLVFRRLVFDSWFYISAIAYLQLKPDLFGRFSSVLAEF
jgi:hypothetical protein